MIWTIVRRSYRRTALSLGASPMTLTEETVMALAPWCV